MTTPSSTPCADVWSRWSAAGWCPANREAPTTKVRSYPTSSRRPKAEMRFQYLLEQALGNLRRNVLVVFAAVVAVLVMLTLVFGTIVVRWSIDQDIGRWDDNVRVLAFLSDALTLDDVNALQAEIQSWTEVEDVVYFSKSQALDEFRELFKDQPSLIDVVEEDPSVLPASLRIAPQEAAQYSTISDRLVVIPGIREGSAADEAIDALGA